MVSGEGKVALVLCSLSAGEEKGMDDPLYIGHAWEVVKQIIQL